MKKIVLKSGDRSCDKESKCDLSNEVTKNQKLFQLSFQKISGISLSLLSHIFRSTFK
jgi:hypothetical protein